MGDEIRGMRNDPIFLGAKTQNFDAEEIVQDNAGIQDKSETRKVVALDEGY